MLQVHQSETCSVAACAEIIGAKWTVLIVHELSEGPRRFTQIEHSCAGISPRTLAERLRWLEAEEIVDPPQLRRVAAARRVRADREGRRAPAADRRDAPLRPRLARLRRPRDVALPARSRIRYPRVTTRSRSWSRAPRRSASCATGLRPDSGGAGRFRAGSASSGSDEFLAPAFITFSLERKVDPPWGLRGGQAGAVNGVEIHRARRSGPARSQGHPASDRGRRSGAHHDRRGRGLRAAGRARSGGGAPGRARGSYG